jgi:hypothetical protein
VNKRTRVHSDRLLVFVQDVLGQKRRFRLQAVIFSSRRYPRIDTQHTLLSLMLAFNRPRVGWGMIHRGARPFFLCTKLTFVEEVISVLIISSSKLLNGF